MVKGEGEVPLVGGPFRCEAPAPRLDEEVATETAVVMDVEQRAALPFPRSLPEFQQLFPDDAACAAYLEKARWESGFVCPRCEANGEPFRIASRPVV